MFYSFSGINTIELICEKHMSRENEYLEDRILELEEDLNHW